MTLRKQLGHRKIETSLIYTRLVNFESNDYSSGVAKNVTEASKLVERGFEYVTTYDNTMLSGKRK